MKNKRNKKMLLFTTTTLILSLLSGCGSASNKSDMAFATAESYYAADDSYSVNTGSYSYYEDSFEYDDVAEESAAIDNELTDNEVADNRKLITTINMSVETDNFDALTYNVEERVKALGGYIESSSVRNGYNNCRYSDYTIRIPENRLDEFTDSVSEQSNVLSRNRYVEDVTLSYVDLQSRKEVLRTEQQRLLEMLEAAEDIETMIIVESRLSEVQADLESMESQLRVFDNRINYSTIYLDINEVQIFTVVEEESAWTKMTKGFQNSLYDVGQGFVNFGIGLVISLPYLVVIGLIIFAIVMIIRAIIKSSIKKSERRKTARMMQMSQAQMIYPNQQMNWNGNMQMQGNMQAQNSVNTNGHGAEAQNDGNTDPQEMKSQNKEQDENTPKQEKENNKTKSDNNKKE